MQPTSFLHCSYRCSIFLVSLARCSARSHEAADQRAGREAGPEIRQAAPGPSAEQSARGRWSAGRRLLKSPPASQPDGTPEGASADGTRNPVLSGVRLRPGGGTRNPKIVPTGDSHSLRRLPALHSLAERKKGPAVPTPKSNNRAAQRWLRVFPGERAAVQRMGPDNAPGSNGGTLPLYPALLRFREPAHE